MQCDPTLAGHGVGLPTCVTIVLRARATTIANFASSRAWRFYSQNGALLKLGQREI